MRRVQAFTLIELLFVVAIIALLAGLVVPAMQSFADKGRDIKCQQNLRDLFVLINSAATDNDNQYPRIEADPQNPIHAGDALAKTLLEVIRPYGGSEKNIQCPLDVAGPNWFSKKGTSYMWSPVAEDEPLTNVKVYSRRGTFPMPMSRVRLLSDWDLVHGAAQPGMRKRMNVVYADGHVATR